MMWFDDMRKTVAGLHEEEEIECSDLHLLSLDDISHTLHTHLLHACINDLLRKGLAFNNI